MTRSNAMTKLLAVFTAVAVCTGCTPCYVGIRDTQTIHFDDKETSHAWFVMHNANGNDVIVYCNPGWLSLHGPLCISSDAYNGGLPAQSAAKHSCLPELDGGLCK